MMEIVSAFVLVGAPLTAFGIFLGWLAQKAGSTGYVLATLGILFVIGVITLLTAPSAG